MVPRSGRYRVIFLARCVPEMPGEAEEDGRSVADDQQGRACLTLGFTLLFLAGRCQRAEPDPSALLAATHVGLWRACFPAVRRPLAPNCLLFDTALLPQLWSTSLSSPLLPCLAQLLSAPPPSRTAQPLPSPPPPQDSGGLNVSGVVSSITADIARLRPGAAKQEPGTRSFQFLGTSLLLPSGSVYRQTSLHGQNEQRLVLAAFFSFCRHA